LDDDIHYANENILEQYYQRPAILKDFGWRTISVFTKDWLHYPSKVLENIKKRMTEDAKIESEETTIELDSIINTEIPQHISLTNDNTAISLYDSLKYKTLKFSEGTSNKFWEAAVDNQKLIIRFGRIGTKGQTQIKNFPNKEAAEAEKEKLVQEKLAKGYLE
jgi:predicted DNA-binding WGR domain protein